MKLSAAMVLFAAIVASLIALPTPPPVLPSPATQALLANTDRPSIQPAASSCAQQNWPNFGADCLRYTDDKQAVRRVRAVGDQS